MWIFFFFFLQGTHLFCGWNNKLEKCDNKLGFTWPFVMTSILCAFATLTNSSIWKLQLKKKEISGNECISKKLRFIFLHWKFKLPSIFFGLTYLVYVPLPLLGTFISLTTITMASYGSFVSLVIFFYCICPSHYLTCGLMEIQESFKC